MLVAIVADQRITATCAQQRRQVVEPELPRALLQALEEADREVVRGGVDLDRRDASCRRRTGRPSACLRCRCPPCRGARACAPPRPPPAPRGLPLSSSLLSTGLPVVLMHRVAERLVQEYEFRRVELVQTSEDQVALTRSALEAARTVLKAALLRGRVAGRRRDRGDRHPGHQRGEGRRARARAGWRPRSGGGRARRCTTASSPSCDPDGTVRGALVADLRSGGVRPGDARALMPVFAAHLALLVEKVEVQARRTASYEALVQIGMQIQAAEADVDADAAADRRALARAARHRPRVDGARQRGRADARHARRGRRHAPSRSCTCGSRSATASAASWSPTRTPGRGARLRARPPAHADAGSATRSSAKGSARCCAARCSPARRSSARCTSAAAGRSSSRRSRSRSSRRSPPRARSRSRTAGSTRRWPSRTACSRARSRSTARSPRRRSPARGRAHICVELARLLDTEIVLEQDISPPFRARFSAAGEAPDGRSARSASRSRTSAASHVCGLDALDAAAGEGARARRDRARAGAGQGARRSSRSSGSCRATC